MRRVFDVLAIGSAIVFLMAALAICVAITHPILQRSFDLDLHASVVRTTEQGTLPYRPTSYRLSVDRGGIDLYRVDLQLILTREKGPDGLPEAAAFNPTITLHHLPLLWVVIIAMVAGVSSTVWALGRSRRGRGRGFAVTMTMTSSS